MRKRPRTPASKVGKRQKAPAPTGKKVKKAKGVRSAKGRGRGFGRPFEPGNTAGVGHGRPPIPKDYKLAMEDLGPEGVEACGNIVRDPSHPRHADVAMYLVNRWKGTPKSRTEVSAPGGGPIAVTQVTTSGTKRARAAELVAAARARVAAAKGPSGPGASG